MLARIRAIFKKNLLKGKLHVAISAGQYYSLQKLAKKKSMFDLIGSIALGEGVYVRAYKEHLLLDSNKHLFYFNTYVEAEVLGKKGKHTYKLYNQENLFIRQAANYLAALEDMERFFFEIELYKENLMVIHLESLQQAGIAKAYINKYEPIARDVLNKYVNITKSSELSEWLYHNMFRYLEKVMVFFKQQNTPEKHVTAILNAIQASYDDTINKIIVATTETQTKYFADIERQLEYQNLQHRILATIFVKYEVKVRYPSQIIAAIGYDRILFGNIQPRSNFQCVNISDEEAAKLQVEIAGLQSDSDTAKKEILTYLTSKGVVNVDDFINDLHQVYTNFKGVSLLKKHLALQALERDINTIKDESQRKLVILKKEMSKVYADWQGINEKLAKKKAALFLALNTTYEIASNHNYISTEEFIRTRKVLSNAISEKDETGFQAIHWELKKMLLLMQGVPPSIFTDKASKPTQKQKDVLEKVNKMLNIIKSFQHDQVSLLAYLCAIVARPNNPNVKETLELEPFDIDQASKRAVWFYEKLPFSQALGVYAFFFDLTIDFVNKFSDVLLGRGIKKTPEEKRLAVLKEVQQHQSDWGFFNVIQFLLIKHLPSYVNLTELDVLNKSIMNVLTDLRQLYSYFAEQKAINAEIVIMQEEKIQKK